MARATTYLMDPTVVLTVTIGTVVTPFDITDQVSAVEISQERSDLDKTTFGNTAKRRGRGLIDGSIKLDFYVDFDNDGMFEVFKTLWDGHEYVDFEVEETVAGGAGVTGTFVMTAMPSFSGAVDEYNTASLTFPLDGPATNRLRT